MAIKAPHKRNQAQLDRDNAKLNAKAVEIYDELNQPHIQTLAEKVYGVRISHDTPGHVYLQVDVEDVRLYIHAVPWSRGYSVYVHTLQEVTAMDWRDVDAKYRGLQTSLYAPRGRVGAWHVPNEQIIGKMIDFVNILAKFERVKRVSRWPKDMAQCFQKLWPNDPYIVTVDRFASEGGASWVS